ncbi:MAG: hypothetical protein ACI8UZ_002578 [Akkermansiaceae bacterium]|jgi:hypothetical protein
MQNRRTLSTFLSLLALTSISSGSIVINEFLTGNNSIVVPNTVPGKSDDWIELRNPTGTAVDLGGWHLTDDPSAPTAWTFPAGTIIADNGFLVVFASGDGVPDANGNLHTNFKLSKSGENLALIRPDNSVASEFGPRGTPYPTQTNDYSFGLHPTTGTSVYFSTPTPLVANDANGIARVADLTVTPKRGLYQTAQQVTLSTTTPGATIYYTTDGSPPVTDAGNPSASATVYSATIALDQTTVIRSAAVASGLSPSEPEAHTYLLLDIDNANANGTDAAGLNTSLLQQTKPAGYGNLASGDYNMDTRISRSTTASAGHGGLTVAQAMLEGMREIPTISISLPRSDFTNIYANPQSEGETFEKACSAEFIPAEGDTRSDFQEHCGLRVQGGASRVPNKSPKHSLSFRFREKYGTGRLKEKLFPGVDVENFNSIALRAGYNNSWIHSSASQRTNASMIRDQWMRESMRDMSHQDAGAGFLAHVFINGLYWGLHNIAERQDNVHYAEYNGGESDLIDAKNGTKYVEGNSTAWNAMRSTVQAGNWDDIQQVLDIDTYIDYHLLQRFGANQDLKVEGNWRAAGGGPFTTATEMRPWKLFSWDGERVLESPTATNLPLDPMSIRNNLQALPEYRQRFADRAQMHLTGNGALTPAACEARWEKYASAIDKAIIAESARWGDHRRSSNPYDRDDWLIEQNRLYNSYFPVRTGNVINRLSRDGLYPTVNSPSFAINGQTSEGGFVGDGSLTVNGDDGTIYYTLDGSDPALPDGSIKPGALSIASGTMNAPVFPFESTGWRYLNTGVAQSNSNIVSGTPTFGTGDWKHPSFDDSSWPVGQGLIGGRASNSINPADANTIINIGGFSDSLPTVYFRKKFNVTNPAEVTSVDLSIIRDDGVIVYLNGHEIFRDNMRSGVVAYEDFAEGNVDENSIPMPIHNLLTGQLLEGENILTVELHNASTGSSDLGLDVALNLSRPAGLTRISLSESAKITARLQTGSALSAPVRGTFLLEQAASESNLAITEINYHPREATLVEKNNASPLVIENRDQFEFIEFLNTGSDPINLGQASFSDGLNYEFDLRAIASGERVLLVRDQAAFLARYGNSLTGAIAGTFSGGLNNDGESLTLLDRNGSVIKSLTYNDSGTWPSRPDGAGSSLEIIAPSGDPNDPLNWAPSVSFHGSPGSAGLLNDHRIVINEVSSNSTSDFIELYNTTASSIEIGGWLLTDSKNVYQSYPIPTITMGGLEYFTIQAADYDAPASNPITNYAGTSGASPTTVTSNAHGLTTGELISIEGYGGFSEYNESFEVTVINANTFTIDALFLDNNATKGLWQKGRSFGISGSKGDDLWLLETDSNGNPLAFVDHVEFAAAAPNTTLGRWLDGMGYDTLVTMTESTAGATNSGPVLGPVYLSEVHYAPTSSDAHEFVEITNQGTTTVSLDQWKLRGGLDFDFTPAHSIPAGQSLVIVGFNPVVNTVAADNFRANFGIGNEVTLIGPATDGPLDNERGTVRLQQAGASPEFGQITVDEVRYEASTPWPLATGGPSLTRNVALAFGKFSNSWSAASPTPGSIIVGEDYATWAAANSVGAEEADDDGDLLSNFLEFAMGTDPTSPDEQPVLTISGSTGTVTFPRHLGRSGVTLQFQTSTELKIWTTQSTSATNLTGSIQTNEFTIDLANHPELYWRLRALGQ